MIIRRGGAGYQKNMEGKIVAVFARIVDGSLDENIRFFGNIKNLNKEIKHLKKYDYVFKYAFEINRSLTLPLVE